ncbi:MAG: CBS domain-containing protein [Methanoregula sp.]|jgi:CBS domain-containing protein|uniref:CBS domain-containing protein n=1 Tax=Methanoregula sp. TaxID=2052170 RepID=UPI0025E47789|nr:CBS domain-containing protein [Methanoregula sp.]MCK9631522.1 CBS domain-containing protein [Methanoregula sp.]
MLVQDAMTKDPVVCTSATPLRDVVALFRKNHIGGLPVMEGKELVGMITESDLISLLETERISDDLWLPSPFEVIEVPIREYINWEKTKHALTNIGDMPAKKVMTHRVITATGEMDVEAAASLMLKEGIARLPVMEGKKIVGIITRADIINAIGSSYSGKEGGE